MRDSMGRTLNYLRISVTDRCNLRCRYCMPRETEDAGHENILTYEEILRLAGLFSRLGIERIRITGGEPLVRKNLPFLVRGLKEIPGIRTVTITTNGVLLREQLEELIKAGIDGINISLDTLDPDRFKRLTGRDALDHVREGIGAALSEKIPVRINCVPIAGFNEDELCRLASLAKSSRLDVRFIEMMPIGYGAGFSALDSEAVLKLIKGQFPGLKRDKREHGCGPAVYYREDGMQGSIGLIGGVHHSFCSQCSRLRLTSRGFLKTCLFFEDGTDLREPLRRGAPDAVLKARISEAAERKPERHLFGQSPQGMERKGMFSIGG